MQWGGPWVYLLCVCVFRIMRWYLVTVMSVFLQATDTPVILRLWSFSYLSRQVSFQARGTRAQVPVLPGCLVLRSNNDDITKAHPPSYSFVLERMLPMRACTVRCHVLSWCALSSTLYLLSQLYTSTNVTLLTVKYFWEDADTLFCLVKVPGSPETLSLWLLAWQTQ